MHGESKRESNISFVYVNTSFTSPIFLNIIIKIRETSIMSSNKKKGEGEGKEKKRKKERSEA